MSWLVKLLPFIEEYTLYKKFDQEAGAYAAVNAPVRDMPLTIGVCPSYPGTETVAEDGKIAITTYAGSYHDLEEPIDVDNHGLMFLNSQVRLDEIYDGSTHTLLIAETLERTDDLGWVSGTRATLRNTNKIEERVPQFPPPQDSGMMGEEEEKEPDVAASLYVGGFGGHHPGGLNAVFADGSTRFISESIDPALWRQAGNRSDGQLVKPF